MRAETPVPTDGGPRLPLPERLVPAFLSLVAAAYFYVYFDEPTWQPSVDLAWLVSVVAWMTAFWRRDVPSLPRLRQPLWFYVLYALCLLPFCTNWRWSIAGDTLS